MNLMRSTAIALIAMVMPLGLDISGDGDVSFGAPVAHAKISGFGKIGKDKGNNGLGNGGEASQGENEGGDSDPSNPGGGGKDDRDAGDGAGGGVGDKDGGGGADGGGSWDGGEGEGGSSTDGGSGGGGDGGGGGSSGQGGGSGIGSTPSAPGPSVSKAAVDVFNGSAEPVGPDLTEKEEQDLISRGWQ